MAEKVLIVSGEGFARMYGQGERGMGHALLIPAGFQGDPLASGARIARGCGSTLESLKATEKFQGDKTCPKCVEWLATPEGAAALETARAERHAWEFGTDDVRSALAESAPAVPEVREESATVSVSGWDVPADHARMVAETAAYYANGGKPSAEILALPAPGMVSLGTVMVSGSAAEILVCEFRGGVEIINPERTHGKCPECTTYIPLLPDAGARESAPRLSKSACDGSGSAPTSGTLVLRDDHTVKVADDHNGKTSAPCPECSRMIAVSRDRNMRRHNGVIAPEAREESADRIGTHNVGGVATPAHKGLTSRMIDTVEHGSIPGDTATADKRRTDESRCKRGNRVLKDATGGTVDCPECARPVELLKIQRPGKEISWKIPHHVRPGESVRHVGHGEVRDVTPRGEGADVGATVTPGARLALSRGHGSTDGAANTGSQNMAPVQPRGWLGTAGTMSLPAVVRPGIDPEVTGRECVLCGELPEIAHKGKSKSWRRNHSSKVGAILRERNAVRDARKAAEIASGERLAPGVRKAARKAASVGSFSEGTCGGVVTHETRPEFAPKGERKPAPTQKHTVRSGKAE